MTDRSQITLEILQEICPDECAEVGPTYLRYIADNKAKYESFEGGSYMDVAGAIAVLASVATVVQLAFYFIDKDREEKGRQQSRDDLINEVIERLESSKTPVDKAVIDQIVVKVEVKLKSRK